MQKFREMAGMGAAEYLNRLRIQKACEEILSGSSISGAAFDCGFRNLSNFNRQFRMMVGCTPREYRGRNQCPPAEIAGRGIFQAGDML